VKGRHTRNLLALAVLCLGAAILLWIYFGVQSTPKRVEPAAITESNAEGRESLPKSAVSNTVSAPTATTLEAAFLTPIAVYGQVIDQDGKPVPGASVTIGIADRPFETGSSYVRETDGEGRFSLTGVQGISFTAAAAKEGYYSSSAATGHRNVVVSAKDDVPQPTEQTPLVLVLQKQGNPVPLIIGSSGQIEVPRSGSPVSIDVTTGKKGSGNIQISAEVGDARKVPFDWRFEISVPDGGISRRNDSSNFQAPRDGYQAAEIVEMKANDARWSSSGEGEYFAKLADGRYTRFVVRFYPSETRNFVVVESHTNPTPGDPNLEFDSGRGIHP
jgi:hypothetical protein